MPRGNMMPRYCTVHGCGLLFAHKKEFSEKGKLERKKHRESGECNQRVIAFRNREEAARQASSLTSHEVDGKLAILRGDLYREVKYLREEVVELGTQVARLMNPRAGHTRLADLRADLPAPWNLGDPIPFLKEAGINVQAKFREIVLKPQDNWGWRGALTPWFHFILDQTCVDPITLRRHETVEYYEFEKKLTCTRVQFMPCLGKRGKGKWNRADQSEGFFGAFWLMHSFGLRKMYNWENHILFELKHKTGATERAIRTFDKLFPDNPFEPPIDMTLLDIDLAQLFYHVLEVRRDRRKAARTPAEATEEAAEEAYEADLEEKFTEK